VFHGYDGVNLPVVGQVKLVGVTLAVDLLDNEGSRALLAKLGVPLAWNLVAVMERYEGPVSGF
jgi:hypothetical protein